jgi:hypothetical protein
MKKMPLHLLNSKFHRKSVIWEWTFEIWELSNVIINQRGQPRNIKETKPISSGAQVQWLNILVQKAYGIVQDEMMKVQK